MTVRVICCLKTGRNGLYPSNRGAQMPGAASAESAACWGMVEFNSKFRATFFWAWCERVRERRSRDESTGGSLTVGQGEGYAASAISSIT